MYDGVTRYSVPNPINWYSLGSDDDLKKNSDGPFTRAGKEKRDNQHY